VPFIFMPYLIFYVLLTFSLTQTIGIYDPGYAVAIGVGYLALAGWVVFETRRGIGEIDSGDVPVARLYIKAALTLIALLSVLQLALLPGLVYAVQGTPLLLLRTTLALADVLVAGLVLAEWVGRERWVTAIFWLALGLLLLARVFTVLASPSPYIDVFTLTNQASDFLLAGQNPYTQTYRDLYNGLYDYVPGPNYWPGYYLWSAVFRAAGDIRWGAVLADGVVAVALLRVFAKLQVNQSLGRWAVLAWLAFPVSLYVLEQAWIEPVIVMLLVLAVWALIEGKWAAAGVALGMAAATKQYVPLLVVFTIIVAWRNFARRNVLQTVLWAGGTFAVIMFPFVIANPIAFFEQTVATYLTRGPRLEGLSVVAWFANEFRVTLDTWVVLLVYGLTLALSTWVAWRQRTWGGWAALLAVALGGVFIFGTQAFCNYYYLLSFLLFIAGCLGQRPIGFHDSNSD
jgi:hypothetical protein